MSLARIVELLNKRLTNTESETLEFGASDTTKSFTFEHRGSLAGYVLDMPDFTNSVTATIALADSDSYTLYSNAGLAENTEHFVNGDTNNFPLCNKIPCDGIMTVTVTLNGAPGGTGGDVVVKLFLR